MNYQALERIHVLIERDKFDLALEKINAALTEFPDSDELYSLQATVFLKKKDFLQAKNSVERAIGLNPENDYLFYLNARVALEREDYKVAEKNINTAIELNPVIAYYHGVKAALFVDQKKYEQAIEFAEQGLEFDPDDLMCNNMLSLAQNRSGKFEEAYNRLENLLADDPENELTHANTGFYHLHKGDVNKAKEHFAVALATSPNYEFARSGMVQALKSSNFLYAKLLQFSFWMDRIGNKNRWVLTIGVLIAIRVVPILVPFYLVFILWTWFTSPISDILLYFDKYGRYLMSPLSLRLTQINIGVVALTALAVVAGLLVHSSFLALAFGLFLSIIPVFLINNSIKAGKRITMIGFASLFTGAGFYAVYSGYLMQTDVMPAWTVIIFSAIAFSWVTAAIND